MNETEQPFSPLIECETPFLIGVRHHSAAMAKIIPQLLNDFGPDSICLELPADLCDWVRYLSAPETHAPIALSGVTGDGQLSFYPLADFSPELATIQWAAKNKIPVVPFDLPLSAKEWPDFQNPKSTRNHDPDFTQRTLEQLLVKTQSEDTGQLWERLVESPSLAQTAEAVRKAALMFGWAVRASERDFDIRNEAREAHMRETLRKTKGRCAAVIGSFHAQALLPDVLQERASNDSELLNSLNHCEQPTAVSLVPYSFSQLDERSGYPAGIRDPLWHQAVTDAKSLDEFEGRVIHFASALARDLRHRGYVAGTPDVTEVIRMMRDLAHLRNLPVAGRSEFIEAVQTCLVQGELYGRGQAVARSLERILIGQQTGQVSADVPVCGLQRDIEQLFTRFKLPKAKDAEKEVRLDVLRDARDRARAVILRQLATAQIPYATRLDTVQQGAKLNLAERWKLHWQPVTSAMISAASQNGVTLEQVAAGIVRRLGQADDDRNANPQVILDRLRIACECGLQELVRQSLRHLDTQFQKVASLTQLVDAASWIGRIDAGHVIGLPIDSDLAFPPVVRTFELNPGNAKVSSLLQACLDRLVGLEGSNRPDDVSGLVELAYWFSGDLYADASQSSNDENEALSTSLQRLKSWCRRVQQSGSHRMRGASAAMRVVLSDFELDDFGRIVEGWFDAATSREGREHLRYGLAGSVQVLLPLAQNDTACLASLNDRFRQTSDAEFLKRLPPLRGGFSELSPADRLRLLDVLLEEIDDRQSSIEQHAGSQIASNHEDDVDVTAHFAAWQNADLAGKQAVEKLGLRIPWHTKKGARQNNPGKPSKDTTQKAVESIAVDGDYSISLADRWRLALGVTEPTSQRSMQAARSLERLYGHGKGEGASNRLANRTRGRGGTEAPEPTTIEWAEDLEDLFGIDICQEVLAETAGTGDPEAIEMLDVERVQPSIELLRQILELATDLPADRAAKLRRLANRITKQLAEQLANRLRPTLFGLQTARPTRRPNRRLNLARTIRDNLANVYRKQDGRPAIAAKRLVFQAAAKRELDWHIHFVVDVSASMSASVIYSALVAAIFSELPAVHLRFLAFSTEVIDLSGNVQDPLTLLLRVQVGGGTHIGLGLRAAREGIKLPSRSIVILVSDFEEGVSVGEMLSEVRAIVSSGAKCLGLAALDDTGVARFHQGCAQMVASVGMPVAAVSPENLARWVGDQIRGSSSSNQPIAPSTIT